MKNLGTKKSFKTLADRLKDIRRRPLSQSDVDDLNRTFDEIEKDKTDSKSESPKKKIARSEAGA
jgi:hypothetical protein